MNPKDRLDMVRAQQQALASMEATLADIAAAIEKSDLGRAESALQAIESSMADLIAVFEKGGIQSAIEKAVATLADIKPQFDIKVPESPPPAITVQVNPTPVTLEATLPPIPAPVVHVHNDDSQKGATWEVTYTGPGGYDRKMTIKRVA